MNVILRILNKSIKVIMPEFIENINNNKDELDFIRILLLLYINLVDV